jgi:glutamyl-tRNA reductase
VIALNLSQRQKEAVKAESIVEEEVVKFQRWLKTLSVVPTIISLREKVESIIQTELKKSRANLRDLTADQQAAVRTLARSIAEKILSDPVVFLKQKADRPSRDNYLDVTRKLFNLDERNGK